MSRKTRSFALAAATASLVGLSAPVAGAATLQGGPNGFNNDSVLNLSGNQIPVQLCNNDIPVNVAGVQVPVDGVSGVLGLLNSGPLSSSGARSRTAGPGTRCHARRPLTPAAGTAGSPCPSPGRARNRRKRSTSTVSVPGRTGTRRAWRRPP